MRRPPPQGPRQNTRESVAAARMAAGRRAGWGLLCVWGEGRSREQQDLAPMLPSRIGRPGESGGVFLTSAGSCQRTSRTVWYSTIAEPGMATADAYCSRQAELLLERKVRVRWICLSPEPVLPSSSSCVSHKSTAAVEYARTGDAWRLSWAFRPFSPAAALGRWAGVDHISFEQRGKVVNPKGTERPVAKSILPCHEVPPATARMKSFHYYPSGKTSCCDD
jgi:hypothetical protein